MINASRVYTFLIIFVVALESFNVSVVMIPKKSIACSSLSLKFIVEVLLWVVSILAIVVSYWLMLHNGVILRIWRRYMSLARNDYSSALFSWIYACVHHWRSL